MPDPDRRDTDLDLDTVGLRLYSARSSGRDNRRPGRPDRRQQCRRDEDAETERYRARIRFELEVLKHIVYLAVIVGTALGYLPAEILAALGAALVGW